MRKVFLPLTGVMLVLAVTCAQAVDTVQFSGKVYQTCSLKITGSPVDLGTYPTSRFAQKDSSTETKPFTIDISGCANSSVSLKWSGNIVDGMPDLLKVDEAKGLGIRVIETKDPTHPYKFNSIADKYITVQASGSAQFALGAYYISYQDGVTPGSANASANVELAYK